MRFIESQDNIVYNFPKAFAVMEPKEITRGPIEEGICLQFLLLNGP